MKALFAIILYVVMWCKNLSVAVIDLNPMGSSKMFEMEFRAVMYKK